MHIHNVQSKAVCSPWFEKGRWGVGLQCGGVLDAVDVLIACSHKELEMSVLCQASIHQQRVGEEGVEGGEEARQVKV